MHTATNFCVSPARPNMDSPRNVCEVQAELPTGERWDRILKAEVPEFGKGIVMWQAMK